MPRSSERRIEVKAALLLIAAFFLAACDRPARSIAALDETGSFLPGTVRIDLSYDGLDRSYLVHLPPQAVEGEPLAVVVNFHGGGGNASGHRDYTGMDSAADASGYIAVYPDGTGPLAGRLLTWNAGTCCGSARDEAVDDVGFTRAVIEDLASRTPIDAQRIYATGLSNGAMMAYRLAAEAPDLVAAIAPVAGAMALDPLTAAAPVPVLHIHSLDDPRALYHGGVGPPFPLTTHVVEHNPVESVLAFWAANNGCRSEPAETETRRSAPDPDGVEHTATRLEFGPCGSGAEVILWRLAGAGHVWPGGQRDYLTGILGPGTDVVDANREMWLFFERFSLEE
jgi:polyhydroxybutyrate depolymerase